MTIDCNKCIHLNMTEEEQTDKTLDHICKYYGRRVLHRVYSSEHTPELYPCFLCQQDKYKYYKTKREVEKNMLTTKNDFKVELINGEECKDFFKKWGTFACTCYNTPKKFAEKVGQVCYESGHNSGSRAFHFIFDIKDVPRSLVDQLVRHENGVAKNVQSFRYVKKDGTTVYIPHLIAKYDDTRELFIQAVENMNLSYDTLVTLLQAHGHTGEECYEQARGVLVMNTNTGLTIGFTYEALVHLANERLCTRAEYPIRMLVKQMVVEVLRHLPQLQDKLVAKCITNMYCNEEKCCGIRPKKEEVQNLITKALTPTKVYDNIMNGIPMKLPEWEGYWVSEDGVNIKIYCKDGRVLDLRESTDTKYTLDHIFKRFDWEYYPMQSVE